jgi:hypothetical protein
VSFFCRVVTFIAVLLLRLDCGVMIEEAVFSELTFLLFASELFTVGYVYFKS